MPVDIGLALESAGQAEEDAEIVLSSELVSLLSAQLYQSPVKAVEELVVNSYDADASNCWVHVTSERILVIDDGVGMDHLGIRDLWHVGHSTKRDEAVVKARKRKQIGKFGIGKLATAAIARRVTYITKAVGAPITQVLATSVDYSVFESQPSGGKPVALKVRRISVDEVLAQAGLGDDLKRAKCDQAILSRIDRGWTIVLLEDLKPDAQELKSGRLKWVLSTAMPLPKGFAVFLNGDEIKSSKETAERIVSFNLKDLPAERLANLEKATKETWVSDTDGISSPSFPSVIKGTSFVTRQSLYGKSDDLARSHGFFIRVRGRLVNLDDPLFGLKPSSHAILNRFYCEIEADDLDEVLTAPREGVELSDIRQTFIKVLNEIFNHARGLYEAWVKANQDDKSKKNKEYERNYVNPRLVERPIADALLGAAEGAALEAAARKQGDLFGEDDRGDDEERSPSQAVADAGWFYLRLSPDFDLSELTKSLYSDERVESYRYERTSLGRPEPMVRFDPAKSTFQINVDHDLIRAHDDSPDAQKLVEDVVTAEALLEVYLREVGLNALIIEEILSRRDELLRSLTKDRIYSLKAIALELRDAADNETDLEVQLVVAARALGFVANHIGGVGEPDGIARLMQHPGGEVKITLEAKSSTRPTAGLAAIAFDGLQQHMDDHKAVGCLLIAPGYPGGSQGENAAAAKRAQTAKVSCWTVDQLARVIEAAEERHIAASRILEVIVSKFRPEDVTKAVEDLLKTPEYTSIDLYRAVLRALRGLHGKMKGSPRTAELITGRIVSEPQFENIEQPEVEQALRDLAGASRGAMTYNATSGRVVVHVELDELERRASRLLGIPGQPRHTGKFTTGDPDAPTS
ncbi:ATP-binding protein [Actinophytocola sp. KF-1]